MSKKIIIGFQADKEFKERLIEAGKKFKIDGVPYPLKLSAFCRVATEKLLYDIMKKDNHWDKGGK